jgi:hypothetical protein
LSRSLHQCRAAVYARQREGKIEHITRSVHHIKRERIATRRWRPASQARVREGMDVKWKCGKHAETKLGSEQESLPFDI